MVACDLPLNGAASEAIALPAFAACVVSFATRVENNWPDSPADDAPALIRLVPVPASWEASCSCRIGCWVWICPTRQSSNQPPLCAGNGNFPGGDGRPKRPLIAGRDQNRDTKKARKTLF